MQALRTAATGMAAQQMNVEVISNNIANMNTVGYKKQRAEFQDLLYQNIRTPGEDSSDAGTIVPVGVQIGIGVKAAAVYRLSIQGNLSQTGNPLDIAIQGSGFFQVRLATGQLAYTRDGSFQMDKNGIVVDSSGNPLDPQITIPPNAQSVTIATDGTVSYMTPGQTNSQQAGQIQLAMFQNPAGLTSIGQNLYQPTDASGDATVAVPGGTEGLGTLMQGYTEQSNVSVVDEFINLIVAQRAYEANSKVVKAADEMYQQVNNLKQ